ncbi:MAG: RNA polymerase subunit sigma, partial [Planctomycetales bacterium]|nr:RNA polymerase subunit sigma [Planctomycetales bacterium]
MLIQQIEAGNRKASEELLPLIYSELRRLAQHRLNRRGGESPSMQATALVHEAYIRLVDSSNKQEWDSHGHFFAAAAEAMR